MRLILILFLIAGSHAGARGQVLISILLGDKLNSGKIEFGLDGGLSLSSVRGLNGAQVHPAFNLGFYFDFRMPDPAWAIHTGVMVKSTMGADDLPVYPLNDPDLDAAFEGGSVRRKIGYFNVPVLMKYTFANHFFVEAGPMISLIARAVDEFEASVDSKDDLTFTRKIRDAFHPLDAGAMAAVGYRLMGGNGMNLAVRYYAGLVDITIDDSTGNQYNRAFYFAVGIPIGAGKAQKREAQNP